MTLENLLGISLDRIQPDQEQMRRLLEAARVSLKDAQMPDLSNESRFDLAYKAIMQTANLGLMINGFRTLTSRPGHHQTMIQSLPKTIGLDVQTTNLLDQMRKLRNGIDYEGDVVSGTMADEVVGQAGALLLLAEACLAKNKSI